MNTEKPFQTVFIHAVFQESVFSPEVQVTRLHCGFTVHVKEGYTQGVHSRQAIPAGGGHRGYGKQVWPLLLFVSLIQLAGGHDVWDAHTVSCTH